MARKNSVFKKFPFDNDETTSLYRNLDIFNNLDTLNKTLILDFVQEKSFFENTSSLDLTFKNLDEVDTTITDFNLDNLIVNNINIEAIHTNITNGFRNSIEIGNLDVDDYNSNMNDINIIDNSNMKNTDIDDSNDLINNSNVEDSKDLINNSNVEDADKINDTNINDVSNSDTKSAIDNPIHAEFEAIIQSLEKIINNLQNSNK